MGRRWLPSLRNFQPPPSETLEGYGPLCETVVEERRAHDSRVHRPLSHTPPRKPATSTTRNENILHPWIVIVLSDYFKWIKMLQGPQISLVWKTCQTSYKN